jgi:hypothetical protein
VVLFHTDDAGLLSCANRGAIAALEAGLARSWSVMMPCPGVSELADYLAVHPDVDSGVHVTLTSEWPEFRWRPLSGPDPADGLTDPDGYLWPDARSVMRHARAEAVEREIRSQVDAALARGLPVTHLDCHMATAYTRPDFFAALANVGREMGVPVMAEAGRLGWRGRAARFFKKAGGRTGLAPSFVFPRVGAAAAGILWDAGLPLVDAIHADSYGWPPHAKIRRMSRLLRGLPPGITVILVHCALPAEDGSRIAPGLATRIADTEALCSDALRGVIRDAGIHTTTWKELLARRREYGPQAAAT